MAKKRKERAVTPRRRMPPAVKDALMTINHNCSEIVRLADTAAAHLECGNRAPALLMLVQIARLGVEARARTGEIKVEGEE